MNAIKIINVWPSDFMNLLKPGVYYFHALCDINGNSYAITVDTTNKCFCRHYSGNKPNAWPVAEFKLSNSKKDLDTIEKDLLENNYQKVSADEF